MKIKENTKRKDSISQGIIINQKGITLLALIITIVFSYDEMIKFSNSKGFLLATI